jgi:hypothetical protein
MGVVVAYFKVVSQNLSGKTGKYHEIDKVQAKTFVRYPLRCNYLTTSFVFLEVRTELLNVRQVTFSFQRLWEKSQISFTLRPLYLKERAPDTHWIGSWVGPRAVLDAVVKRKIPSPRRESNPRTPIVQPATQRCTD